MTKPELIQIDPCSPDYRLHPLYKDLPGQDDDGDQEFLALCDDIARRGVTDPIKVTPSKLICDGRRRSKAAKRQQLASIPALVVPEEEAVTIALASLCHRTHYTKGARAYLAYPHLKTAHDEAIRAEVKRRESGKRGPLPTQSATVGTVQELAVSIGVSKDVFEQAKKVHELFKDKDLKAVFEPKILAGEVGLGACIAGIAGQSATKGKGKRVNAQLDLFTGSFDSLTTRYRYWQKFDEDEKRAATASITTALTDMPDDLLSTFGEEVKAEITRRKRAAAQA